MKRFLVPLWLLAIALSILWLDRPWAEFAQGQAFKTIAIFPLLTKLADLFLPLALLGLAAAGLAALRGWRPGPTGGLLLCLCLAVAIALMAKTELKYLFGRTWPETWVGGNPSWIRDGVFGFSFLHGGQGWESFPSGHTTVTSAPMAVLWRRWPRFWALWALPVVLVAVGLLACDYHWISDVLAGAGVGVASGLGAWALMARREGGKLCGD